jgi:hypothetical protein
MTIVVPDWMHSTFPRKRMTPPTINHAIEKRASRTTNATSADFAEPHNRMALMATETRAEIP